MSELVKKHLTFQIKAGSEDTSGEIEFEGWATVYDVLDYDGEVMAPGCFAKSVSAINNKSQKTPLMLWHHQMWDPPIGKWHSFEETEKGLYAKGSIYKEADPLIRRGVKDGTIDGLSVGFMGEGHYDENSRVLVWKECVLMETSLCNYGANPDALLTHVKAGNKIGKREMEKILRDSGYSKSQAQTLLSAYDPVLRDSAGETSRLLAEINKVIKSIKEIK